MSRPDATMYLIRHGATASNQAGVLQGRGVDHPLSPSGRRQIEQTADALADETLDAVYASPLQRAVESAEIIAARRNLPVEIVDGLVEVDVGRWEGLSWREIKERDAAAYQRFMEQEGGCGYPDGESYVDVLQRVRPVFATLLDQQAGRRFAVVAHSVVNRVYVAHLMQAPADFARQISQSNGCINIIRRRDEVTRAVTVNAAIHVA